MKTTPAPALSVNSPKNYNAIDVVKFVCAILVIFIHIPPITTPIGGTLSPLEKTVNFWLQNFLPRLAVPFYFVCSGFLLFRKMPPGKIDTDRVKTFCFKLIRLFGLWKILLFLGWNGQLWYLSGTVIAVAFVSFCLYRGMDPKWLGIIAGGLYVLGLLGDSYFGLIKPFVSHGVGKTLYDIYTFFIPRSRNGLFTGTIFIFMGYRLAQGNIPLKPGPSLALFGASVPVLFAEVWLLHHFDIPQEHNMYVSLLPSVYFLFTFAASLPLQDRPIYGRLRTAGVLIYYLHLLVNAMIVFGIGAIYGVFRTDLMPLHFWITVPASLIIAFGIEWLSRQEKFRWIKQFIT